jgi:hypothetical protein
MQALGEAVLMTILLYSKATCGFLTADKVMFPRAKVPFLLAILVK